MSWRVVVVSSNAKVDLKMDYLVIRTVDQTRRVHLSEIAVLMLESTAISITAYALCELVERRVKVIFCDRQRNPHSELLPCGGSHDSTAKIRQQLAWKPEARQAIWTELVRAKISGQRDVLLHRCLPQADILTGYLQQLQLGDATNREGHAAKVYFNALFGMEFTRGAPTPINAALNYGYGLVLSAVKPMIDHAVSDMMPENFEKEEKRVLIQLLNSEVSLAGKRQVLLYAIRLYCASVFRALQNNDLGELRLIGCEL